MPKNASILKRLPENRTARNYSWFGLVAFLIGGLPASLWSQGLSLSRPTGTVADQSFARFDDSLTRVADTLNGFITSNTATANRKATAYETPRTSPVTYHDCRPRYCWDNGKFSVSAAGLDPTRSVVEIILKSHGVPTELAAVILVESGGRAAALSSKGARGLWQLMPDTARRYGLRVDAVQDDRLDTRAATNAAARYLQDLYAQFGNWKLALAAYNTGEANVASAILRAHTQDFDQLSSLRMLPTETLEYVPKVLANVNHDWQSGPAEKGHRPPSSRIVFAVSGQ